MKKFNNIQLESRTTLMVFNIDMSELGFIREYYISVDRCRFLDILVNDNKLRCSRQTIEDGKSPNNEIEWNICGSGRTLLKYEIEGLEQIYQKYLRYNKLNRIIL